MGTPAERLAILALTTRAVPSDVPPLTGRQLAALRRHADLVAAAGDTVDALAARAAIPIAEAERITRLLDRATAAALVLESWEQSGIWTVTVADDGYPARLRDVLGDGAPPVLHGAGERDTLTARLLGVVGSRNVHPDAAAVATRIGEAAPGRGMGVVSGGARGVDALAMNAARRSGGRTAGVLAESLLRSVRSAETRRAVLDGALTLVTPYAPGAGFSAGQAMGRNKIIYALAERVVVVTADEGSGGTWGGATEALAGQFGDVAVWMGAGAGQGNAALVDRGARPVGDLVELFSGPSRSATRRKPGDDQMSFAV